MSSRASYAVIIVSLVTQLVACSPKGPSRDSKASEQPSSSADSPATQFSGGGRRVRGMTPKPGWAAAPPEARNPPSNPGLRCNTDGKLDEWQSAKWLPLSGGSERPDAGRWAYASYGRGLCVVVFVRDSSPKPATVVAALPKSDYVEVSVQISGGVRKAPLRLQVGSERKLVNFVASQDRWRESLVSANGVAAEGGYVVEVRLPLSALTPVRSQTIERATLSVSLFDGDTTRARSKKVAAQSVEANFSPVLEVPLRIQQRVSSRICHGGFNNAVWSYDNGWRCSLVNPPTTIVEDDMQQGSLSLAHIRVPEAPKIPLIAQRLVAFNFLGGGRGGLALVDPKETIYSIVHLGVVGRSDPGNERVKTAEARPFKLPDGDWAVEVVHSFLPGTQGCSSAPETFLSIVALRRTTVGEPAAATPPYLEEIFRHPLNSCNTLDAWGWQIFPGDRRIQMNSILKPSARKRLFGYKEGRYRPVNGDS